MQLHNKGLINLSEFNKKLPSNMVAVNSDSTSRQIYPDIRQIVLKRSVVDALIHFFLQEISQICEMIYPAMFLEKYYSWWRQSNHGEKESFQFGLHIIWLCLTSLQVFPYPNFSQEGIDNISVEVLENRVYQSAIDLKTASIPSFFINWHLAIVHLYLLCEE